MRVIIQSPRVLAREPLLDFVRQKVGKLSEVSDLLLEARVLLKVNRSDVRENKICEIRGIIYGNDLFAEKQASTFEEATLKAIDAVKRQITDLKDKQITARPEGI
ncbi:MAG: HPF/RaiA family ribosome-associated protein [Chryseosolibacter sp.]